MIKIFQTLKVCLQTLPFKQLLQLSKVLLLITIPVHRTQFSWSKPLWLKSIGNLSVSTAKQLIVFFEENKYINTTAEITLPTIDTT